MSRQQITVRSADPVHADGLAFARYVGMASEGQFRILLGPRVNDILARAFSEPRHDLSYEHTLFAELDGEIVGMASGYTAEQHRRSSDEPLERAAGGGTFRMACMFALATPILRFIHTYDQDDFYLQFLAVNESCRGQGIGSLLIEAMEARAQSHGSTRFALDVGAKNAGARRLYERCGFLVSARWPKLRFLPPMMWRMIKSLGSPR